MKYRYILAWPLIITVSVGCMISLVIGLWFVVEQFNLFVLIGLALMVILCIMGIILSTCHRPKSIGK